MPQFMVFATDHPPHSMPLRDAKREAHRRYVLDNDSKITLAGVMLDDDGNQCGSVYSFSAANAAEVQAWLMPSPLLQLGRLCRYPRCALASGAEPLAPG
jgi:uncharacterized protein YciI